MFKQSGAARVALRDDDGEAVGIVVSGAPRAASLPHRVSFVWGGEVTETPTLPFGRWKAARAA